MDKPDGKPAHKPLSIAFILAAIMLIVAATGLRPAIAAISKHFTKHAMEIRKSLRTFDPSEIPEFRKGWETGIMESTTEDIETDEFTFVSFKSNDPAADIRSGYLFVTYYNNPKDKVPHTPDVCYRQAGAIINKKTAIKLHVPEISNEPITATLLLMDVKTCNRAVIFFFSAEGKFKNTRGQVRWTIGTPGNKYSYFSKIEASAIYPTGEEPTQAIELIKKILRQSLPVLINEYLPDKKQLR